MYLCDAKKATVGPRYSIQYRTMFITRAQQYSRNSQEPDLLDDVFLVRDFVVSPNVGIWQGFCYSSKECLSYVLLLLIISRASYASLLAYLTCQIQCY